MCQYLLQLRDQLFLNNVRFFQENVYESVKNWPITKYNLMKKKFVFWACQMLPRNTNLIMKLGSWLSFYTSRFKKKANDVISIANY
jgi:hypothetical protein